MKVASPFLLLIPLALCSLNLQAVQTDDKPTDATLGPSRPTVRSCYSTARTSTVGSSWMEKPPPTGRSRREHSPSATAIS